MSRPALLKPASYLPPAMMCAVDPRSSAGQMSAWSDALGFLPPYLCPAHGEAPAGYRLYVTAAAGDDAVLFLEVPKCIYNRSFQKRGVFARLTLLC